MRGRWRRSAIEGGLFFDGGFFAVAHFFDEFGEGDFGLPAECGARFAGVAPEGVDFRRTKVAGVDADERTAAVGVDAGFVKALAAPFDVHAEVGGGGGDEVADGVLFAGGDDEVVRVVLLEHHPHGADEVFGVAPVAFGVEVAEAQLGLLADGDFCEGAGDFAGDEGFAAARGFVVEEDAGAGVEAVGFAVVFDYPVAVEFGDAVGGAGVEGGGFVLWAARVGDFAVELGGGGLVEAAFVFQQADGFEDAEGAEGVDLAGVFGELEGDFDMALGAEVVDFAGFDGLDEGHEVAGVDHVAVVEVEARVDVVDAVGVDEGGAADDAVDEVAFFQ